MTCPDNTSKATDDGTCSARAAELYRASQDLVHRRTDRMFAVLMIIQWVGGIIAAVSISPRTWSGTASAIHLHVWAAVILGGLICSLPVVMAMRAPGSVLTRHIIAVAQTLTSALLIHLTGGRIETHFHVFGSLAFLAFYRDWRVLMTATVVVATDHLLRGLWWPQSVFGVLSASPWRWLEHAGWVLFEDTFLILSIRHSLNDMFAVATRRAELEAQKADVERQVVERAAELTAAHKQLVEASHSAGMAEVATSILHNVGNVLNSVSVSAEVVTKRVRQFRTNRLEELSALLRQNAEDLPAFLTNDQRGRQIPDYLLKVVAQLAEPQQSILQELNTLRKNIDHIKEIVTMQQTHARACGVLEKLCVKELIEDAIRINEAAFMRHQLELVRDIPDLPPLTTDRHKVLQILVNLLGNAKYAVSDTGPNKRLTVRACLNDNNNCIQISVIDNGIGIAPENLTRIFQHGFTTKRDGHGFGLHSGALAAQQLGGRLIPYSAGVGQGATFTLELPLQAQPVCN